MLARAIRRIAQEVPDYSNLVLWAHLVFAVVVATPKYGYSSRMLQPIVYWYPGSLVWPEIVMGILTAAAVIMVLSKVAVNSNWRIAQPRPRGKRLAISLGGMVFDEKALFTNLIAFGAIGSGKTSCVIYPILDAITRLYHRDEPREPDAKWGGFVLDVKGDFHEAVIYVMHKHGRDLLEDLVVIRPDNDYYILEFEEVFTGEHFLVSCMGGTSSQECDRVLETATGPADVLEMDNDGHKVLLIPNGDREWLSSFVFSDRGTFKRPEVHQILTQLEFEVSDKPIRWLGWREDRTGRLTRISHTAKRKPVWMKDALGNLVTTAKPRRLRYLGVHSINNGLTYNLISRSAASTEAAGRIMAVAEVTGNALGGENAYWSNASEKHIAYCIELFRQVEGPMGQECSVNEIQKFTTNEPELRHYLKRLGEVIRRKQAMGARPHEIMLLRNIKDYFDGEWLRLDPKTKGNIQSCVTNLFGDVTRNEQLLKTFCQPARFSFEDCLNQGKVYTLVLTAYPNAQPLIGTCMKLDFQQVVLKRTQAAPVNKNRFIMFLADEYQYFITTSGGSKGGGDEKFLSIARQSRIFNVVCTQAKSSLLAVQRDENKIDAFLQCFGSRVFLQNLDEKTNQLAEKTLGQVWREKVGFQGPDLKLSHLVDGGGKVGSVTRNPEKMNRYDASYFTQLAPFEAVIFNKERPPRKKIVRANLREEARFFDRNEVIQATNDYYRAYIENRAHQLGLDHLFNSRDNVQLDREKEHRAAGTLRSWRHGMPLGLPVSASPDTETDEIASGEARWDDDDTVERQDDLDPEADVTESALAQMARELGGVPKAEDLFKYVNADAARFFSDLDASRLSDPFHKSEDDPMKVPSSASTQAIPSITAKPWPDWQAEEKQRLRERPRRTISNLTTIPEIPDAYGEEQES